MLRSIIVSLIAVSCCWAQRGTGELRLQVVDESGAPLQAAGTLTSQAGGVRESFSTSPEGKLTRQALPFGDYRLEVNRPGFAPFVAPVPVRSAIPVEYKAVLSVAPVSTAVNITDAGTLLDPQRVNSANEIGPESLKSRIASRPGRSVIDLVNEQPGWLLEANGVLHARGSEYQVQYVVDGVPLFDNRSPAFAENVHAEELQSLRVLTGGYPAEYGHKLGGVIEVVTNRDLNPGFHGSADFGGGSFGTLTGYLSTEFTKGKNSISASGEGERTDRYLDPPVEQNFTNSATVDGASVRLERDWTESGRTRVYVHRRAARFLVPNELIQEENGQRQDRSTGESLGQITHQQILSPNWITTASVMLRDTSADLWANALSIPIAPFQDRGFREAYFSLSTSVRHGAHEFKAGVEAMGANLRENFAYTITSYQLGETQVFDPDVPPQFQFGSTGHAREQSAFVQDLYHSGRLTISAGLRFDRYRLRVKEHAFSPRLAAAWSVPSAGLVLRAAYDRVFQTPAVENILLASANTVNQLGGEGIFLPVRPSRGDFVEAGFSKSLGSRLRLDGTWFRRAMDYLADDDLLLNTGVSFPIAFSHGEIHGFETKLEAPRFGPLSGFVSWTNMTGRGHLPVAGGLFLGDEAAGLATLTGSFPITQDQRNTFRARVRSSVGPRFSVASVFTYNSGLPVELDGDVDRDFLASQYGRAIVERVNFDRGRVRPSYSLDLSAGVQLLNREHRSIRLHADVLNVTGHLNVINFAGLFSGTAVDAGRNVAIRLDTQW